MKNLKRSTILFLFINLLLILPSGMLASSGISADVNSGDERNWTIQGQVMENTEPPLPMAGINITIKGTTLGTISDQNGYFSIKAKKGDVIVFNMLGFKPYEHVVTRAISNLNVSLTEDSKMLGEVVVTGFSEEKKLNTISSVATLDISKNLANKPITSLSQSLQGGITGLSVSQGSGMPGGDAATIKIRGISSLQTNNDPLVLVDGVPMDMNHLDPTTIESVTVLKDAAAAAIYGARAANGVIVVKTKRGMPGKINVSYNGYYGIQKATYLPEFVNAPEYMDMVNVAHTNIGSNPIYSQEAIDKTKAGTDPYNYTYEPFNKESSDYIGRDGAIRSGYMVKKFIDEQDRATGQGSLDYPLYRYAEVLLSYVECLVETGDWQSPEVETYINMIRNRAGMPDMDKTVYNTKEKVQELYRRERRLELCFEGKRYNDIRRWGIGPETMTGPIHGAWDPNEGSFVTIENRNCTFPKYDSWPLPQQEATANPNISQPTGWN